MEKNDSQHGVAVDERVSIKKPSLYKVILLNDDYTPMDFVVHILKSFFQKDDISAQEIMLQVHLQGKGVAGTYPFDIAETKVVQVTSYAKKNQHPLRLVLEKE